MERRFLFINLFSFQLDAVAVVDVRTSILSRRLAALPADSEERTKVQGQLADALHVNYSIILINKCKFFNFIQQKNLISITIDSIARRSFMINGDFEKVISQHMKLTQHDCYISATQHLHEKCFDLQVCNDFIFIFIFQFLYFRMNMF